MTPLHALVERGQRDGAFRSDLPTDWLVSMFFTLMHGADEHARTHDMSRDRHWRCSRGPWPTCSRNRVAEPADAESPLSPPRAYTQPASSGTAITTSATTQNGGYHVRTCVGPWPS
jgi:hypothetical protein